jgi:hypothetical protein
MEIENGISIFIKKKCVFKGLNSELLLILNKIGNISSALHSCILYFVIVTRIKFVKICKTITERVVVLDIPYHVATHILKLGPYPNNRFTINPNQYLVNIEVS